MSKVKDVSEFNQKFLDLLTKDGYASKGLTEKIRRELETDDESIEKVLEKFSVFNTKELYSSISEGKKVVLNGTVTFEQFAVALYDEVMGMSGLMQSLKKRGWLDEPK